MRGNAVRGTRFGLDSALGGRARRRRHAGCGKRARDDGGQMTVELALVLPAAIIVAVIAVNAMTFFSQCAEFDRVGRNAVRVYATSPAYEQGLDQSVALVKGATAESLGIDEGDLEVRASRIEGGYATFELELQYRPTLFGMGLRDEVFGIALPTLSHTTSITVDTYKPGMVA